MSTVIRKDSAYSWLVLLVVVLSQVALGGICLNGGIFYIVFRNNLGTGAVETSWLCSMPITLWFYSSPIGSLLTNRYGCRICAFIGGFTAATGLSLGYFASNFEFLFVSYGVLTGLGFGISYTGCVTSLNIYFDKYKTVALGLASVGHNLGAIVYVEFILRLESSYGWKGMMFILGASTFNLCAFSLFIFPREHKSRAKDKETSDKASALSTEDESSLNKRKTINLSIFRNLSFVCFCLSNIMVNTGQGVYILHLPSYSSDAGFQPEDISLLWTMYGILNITGKVLFSFLGQHPRINSTILYTSSIALTGICFGLTPLLLTKPGLLLTAALSGFFYNVTGSLVQAVIYDIVGYERFADGVGMSFPFKGTGNLIGGPVAGVLYTATGNYAASFFLGGASMIFGAVFLLFPTIRSVSGTKHRKVIKTVYEKELIDRSVESNSLLHHVKSSDNGSASQGTFECSSYSQSHNGGLSSMAKYVYEVAGNIV